MGDAAHRNVSDHADVIAQTLATAGGHLAIGFGDARLYNDAGWLSGCVPDQIKAECIAAGVPVIDSRALPVDVICRLSVQGPMIAVGREPDPPPWHALSYAPLAQVAATYRNAGAEVLNLDVPDGELAA